MCICIPKYSDETYSQRLWGTREKKENKYLKRVAIVLVPELDGYLLFVVLRRGCPNIRSIFIARNICLMGRRWVFTDGDKKKKRRKRTDWQEWRTTCCFSSLYFWQNCGFYRQLSIDGHPRQEREAVHRKQSAVAYRCMEETDTQREREREE